MDAIAVADAYRRIIARYVLNERMITSARSVGDVIVPITSARRYSVGDKVGVINSATTESGSHLYEIATIYDISDHETLVLESGLQGSYPEGSVVRKIIGAENGVEDFIKAVYVGQPASISHYPAITVDVKSRTSEWFTMESTKETYTIEVAVMVGAGDHEANLRFLHAFVNETEKALFRSFYPLVAPYWQYTLENDLYREDITFKIDQESLFCGAMVFIESDDNLAFNRVVENLGNGVYRLIMPIGQDFSAGDHVIIPRRHIFNALPETTQYGVLKGGMVHGAMISLKCEEEVIRYAPYLDPLTY